MAETPSTEVIEKADLFSSQLEQLDELIEALGGKPSDKGAFYSLLAACYMSRNVLESLKIVLTGEEYKYTGCEILSNYVEAAIAKADNE